MDALQNRPILFLVFMMVTSGRLSEAMCKDNEFALEDLTCCDKCPKGMFVKANCSQHPTVRNTMVGVRCLLCRTCEDHQRMISECTLFFDTVCENKVRPTLTPPVTTDNATSTFSVPTELPVELLGYTTLYFMASIFVVLIIAATVWKWCVTRKLPEDPAKEPFKIQLMSV